jgi:hypothetical protein
MLAAVRHWSQATLSLTVTRPHLAEWDRLLRNVPLLHLQKLTAKNQFHLSATRWLQLLEACPDLRSLDFSTTMNEMTEAEWLAPPSMAKRKWTEITLLNPFSTNGFPHWYVFLRPTLRSLEITPPRGIVTMDVLQRIHKESPDLLRLGLFGDLESKAPADDVFRWLLGAYPALQHLRLGGLGSAPIVSERSTIVDMYRRWRWMTRFPMWDCWLPAASVSLTALANELPRDQLQFLEVSSSPTNLGWTWTRREWVAFASQTSTQWRVMELPDETDVTAPYLEAKTVADLVQANPHLERLTTGDAVEVSSALVRVIAQSGALRFVQLGDVYNLPRRGGGSRGFPDDYGISVDDLLACCASPRLTFLHLTVKLMLLSSDDIVRLAKAWTGSPSSMVFYANYGVGTDELAKIPSVYMDRNAGESWTRVGLGSNRAGP